MDGLETVSELSFSVGLPAHNDMDVGVIEAEDLVGVGNATFADDPFVSLMDGLWQLIENELDTIEHNLDFEFAPVGFAPAFFEHGMIVQGMPFNSFDESLHAAEDLFSHLLPIFLFTGMGHLDAELVHLPDKLFGRIDAMIEAVLADLDDAADQRLRGVSQQDSVDGKVKIGLHAGGVGGRTLFAPLHPCLPDVWSRQFEGSVAPISYGTDSDGLSIGVQMEA